jgi:hypothetical protein
MSRSFVLISVTLMLLLCLSCLVMIAVVPKEILRKTPLKMIQEQSSIADAVSTSTTTTMTLSPSQVLLLTDNLGSGSATVLDSRETATGWCSLLVTNKHVATNLTKIQVFDQDCDLGEAELLSVHDEADVALVILFGDRPLEVSPLGLTPPEFGDRVFTLGYPRGWGPWLTEGRYSGGDRISSPIWFGFSGGPVYNQDFELIGLATSIVGTFQGPFASGARMVPLYEFHEWLDKEMIRWRMALSTKSSLIPSK